MKNENDTERTNKEDEQRWRKYQRTGIAVPLDRAVAWLETLASGKDVKHPQ